MVTLSVVFDGFGPLSHDKTTLALYFIKISSAM
jgi:hypothetical protein